MSNTIPGRLTKLASILAVVALLFPAAICCAQVASPPLAPRSDCCKDRCASSTVANPFGAVIGWLLRVDRPIDLAVRHTEPAPAQRVPASQTGSDRLSWLFAPISTIQLRI